MDAREAARELGELFPAMYLRFHRRRAKGERMTSQTWAVMLHLSMSGPLTVTEAARHMGRAQSVMSEIVDGMERKGLVERMRDARDKRRVLVWLTDAALATLERERSVLSNELLVAAMDAMSASDRRKLVEGARALVRAADEGRKRER
jgi:DNA-binding MarR family transcriptional regulator